MAPPTSLTASRKWVVLAMLILLLSVPVITIGGAGTATAQEEPFTQTRADGDQQGLVTADPILAQAESDPNSSENETTRNGNETVGNESLWNDSEDPSGGILSLSPTEWAISMIQGLIDYGIGEIESSIDLINHMFVGLPAPGEPHSLETWQNPTDGWWPGIYYAMGVSQVLGILWLMFQTAVSFSYSSTKKRRAAWKRLGFASAMVLGATLFGPLGLHLFGELAVSVAPEGAEFTQSFGDFAQFGLGALVGGVLIFVAINVVALGILAIVALYVLAHVLLMLWPLMWAAWASHGQARSYGSTGIYLYGTVCAIAVLQAFLLLGMFHIDWMEGALGPLGGLVGIVAGLLFTLVYFPITLLKQAHIAGAVGLGVAAANSASGAFDQPKSAAVQRVEQRFQQKWESFRNGGGQQRPSVGQVSSGYDGPGSQSRSDGLGSGSSSGLGSNPGNGLDAKQSGPVIGRVGNSERDRIDYTHKK